MNSTRLFANSKHAVNRNRQVSRQQFRARLLAGFFVCGKMPRGVSTDIGVAGPEAGISVSARYAAPSAVQLFQTVCRTLRGLLCKDARMPRLQGRREWPHPP